MSGLNDAKFMSFFCPFPNFLVSDCSFARNVIPCLHIERLGKGQTQELVAFFFKGFRSTLKFLLTLKPLYMQAWYDVARE